MANNLDDQLVIGIASSALFDLSAGHKVFVEQGTTAYREYQRLHKDDVLQPGPAFDFVRKLLTLNELEPSQRLVEVVLLSRNSPDTGHRIMNSIRHHNLDIGRAVFTQGESPFIYHECFAIDLFLSQNEDDVREAIKLGCPAGRVHAPRDRVSSSGTDPMVRLAFDFDAVLADDSAERNYKENGLEAFLIEESESAASPAPDGPIKPFFMAISHIRALEQKMLESNPDYQRRLRTSIVTARNTPADLKVLNTLEDWGVTIDDAFFLGGVPKGPVLQVLRPDIFFDDQKLHIESASQHTMSAHVIFGVRNEVEAKEEPLPQ